MSLSRRISDLETRAIGAAAEQRRLAARLDALEDLVAAFLPGYELLSSCPHCGFLAKWAEPHAKCDGDGAGELEKEIDEQKH